MLSMMIRPRMLVLCSVLGLALTGCDRQQVAHWLAPRDEDAVGRQYVEDIRDRNFTPVQNALAPGVQVPEEALMALATFLNAGEAPKAVTIVTRNVNTLDGVTQYDLGYQYQFARDLRLIELNLIKAGGVTKIAGLHTYAITVPLQQINAFGFRFKSRQHFVFLAVFALMALFTLFTAIVCWRTQMGRTKGLWLLIILLGFGEFAINWTSGAIYYDLVALELFAVGFIGICPASGRCRSASRWGRCCFGCFGRS